MNHAEQYEPSEHPLGRIRELRLDNSFQGERSVITCPLCKMPLYVFIYKPTAAKAFFLCKQCAWFHARPVLFSILHKAEYRAQPKPNPAAISATLDRLARKHIPNSGRYKPSYSNLSGGKRGSKHKPAPRSPG